MITGALKNVLDYGAYNDGTNATATTAAIQSVLDLAGNIYLPAGTYAINAPLVIKNFTMLSGAGSSTNGSFITYSGTANAMEINNPINASTAAYIVLRDFRVISTNPTPGIVSACISDTGSSFLHITNVAVQGNKYGIIFDQTEVASIDHCFFEGQLFCGFWAVNNSDHTPGALGAFTNQFSVSNCQFNMVSATGTYLVLDEGGACHEYQNNNFNGGGTWMRLSSQVNTKITNNEFEGAFDAYGIYFINTSQRTNSALFGGTVCTFDTNTFGTKATQPAIFTTNGGSQNSIVVIGNAMGGTTSPYSQIQNGANFSSVTAINNYTGANSLIDSPPAAGTPYASFYTSNVLNNLPMGNGNVVMKTSGKGVDFSTSTPGTINPDTAVLGDYQYTKWDPTIAFGGSSTGVTYNTSVAPFGPYGRLTKIGQLISYTCQIILTSKGSASGVMTIKGLPYTSINNSGTFVATVLVGNLASPVDVLASVGPNSTSIIIQKTNGQPVDFTDADATNTMSIFVTGNYYVAS